MKKYQFPLAAMFLLLRTQWMTVSKTNEYRTFATGADISLGKATRYNSVTGFKRLIGI